MEGEYATASEGAKDSSPELSRHSTGATSVKGNDYQHSQASWPDPVTSDFSRPVVDDVSRLNATYVERIFNVRTKKDIHEVLRLARESGRTVSIRGTQHTMGGHSISPGGFVIDMKLYSLITYHPGSRTVTTGTGAQWSHLIKYLNQFGMSPRTMQSYSSFSVGGTVSVNAHGITTDFSLVESIVSLNLIMHDGREVLCSRDSEDSEARQLFGLAIGGFGLFGVITDITMKVDENHRLGIDNIVVTTREFPSFFDRLLDCDRDKGGDVDIKLSRLDITSMDSVTIYIFKKTSTQPYISEMRLKPREMSKTSQLMYKWLAPTMQELRFSIERSSGAALDWSESSSRNVLMYESAAPLARIYSPLIELDDTFILQEYFVPKGRFILWVEHAKPIYKDIMKHPRVKLLNTTIRFVHHDNETALAYSRHTSGMFAFVLYYRLPRTKEAEKDLETFHNRFVEVTLSLEGTFYLPYRHHYTNAQMEKAYSAKTLSGFFALKEKYDPTCMFTSLWFNHYGYQYVSEHYKGLMTSHQSRETSKPRVYNEVCDAPEGFAIPVVSERRTDSYARLFSNPEMRRQFAEEFLVKVFNIENPNILMQVISKAIWDPQSKNDIDVYSAIQKSLTSSQSPLSLIQKTWKQIKQLSEQKEEITRETVSIISKLGKMGQIQDYVSIGDNGKMVIPLKEALGMNGKVWILHDSTPNETDISAVLERGSLDPIGQFIFVDYNDICTPKWAIPNESVDLVTINQGLHHLPQSTLPNFFVEVKRILRPGGLFIVREHNAEKNSLGVETQSNIVDLVPMLDLAHSVFNAVTGVPVQLEKTEIRAFRSIQEWRDIMQGFGFVDTMLYEIQPDDPTLDEMMCFYKPPFTDRINHCGEKTDAKAQSKGSMDVTRIAMPSVVGDIASPLPGAALHIARQILAFILEYLPSFSKALSENIENILPGSVSGFASQYIKTSSAEVTSWFQRLGPFLDASKATGNVSSSFFPSELLLVYPAIKRKASLGKATAAEAMLITFIEDIQKSLSSGQTTSNVKVNRPENALEVDVEQVYHKISSLLDTLPRLKGPDAFDELKIPVIIQRMWKSAQTAAASADAVYKESEKGASTHQQHPWMSFARVLVSYMDARTWKELSKVLDVIIKDKVFPPPLDKIIEKALSPGVDGYDTSPAGLWARSLVALLGSEHIQLGQSSMQANFVGLGQLYDIWRLAQERRKRVKKLVSESQKQFDQTALSYVTKTETTKVRMHETRFHDIHKVGSIKSATYGYTSLTAKPVCVLNLVCGYLRNGTLFTSQIPVDKLEEQRKATVVVEGVRRMVTAKSCELNIEYYPLIEFDETFQKHASTIIENLSDAGLVSQFRKGQGHYNYYKLPEWMQVEIMQIYGQSMENTPWYRFPFFDFIKVYFKVLSQMVNAVRAEHGVGKAIFSMAFATDLVPGIVMSLLFAQLKLLAAPLLYSMGEEYAEDGQMEQIVLAVDPSRKSDLKRVKGNVKSVAEVAGGKGIHIMEVGTFKNLTTVLKSLAEVAPHVTILEISNHQKIHMKVILSRSAATKEEEEKMVSGIKKLPGCNLLLSFRYPVDGTSASKPPLCLSLTIQVASLVHFLVESKHLGVEVAQIYDFYC